MLDKAYESTTGGVHRVLHALLADETVRVSKGQTVLVKIKPVEIPKDHLVSLCAYSRHPLGHAIAVVDDFPKRLEETRGIKVVAFQAWHDGVIKRGDVLGVANFVLTKLEKRIA